MSRRRGKAAPPVLSDAAAAYAIGHPLRAMLLRQLAETETSPAKLAEALGEPIGNVSYHVRMLDKLGAIELVRTAQVRGAVEHFYRAAIAVDVVVREPEDAIVPPLVFDVDELEALVGEKARHGATHKGAIEKLTLALKTARATRPPATPEPVRSDARRRKSSARPALARVK